MLNILQIGNLVDIIIITSYISNILLLFRWKYTVMQDGWKQDNAQPTPCEVIEVVTGYYFHFYYYYFTN